MASKNAVDQLKTEPSTSTLSDEHVNAITELTEGLEIGAEELHIDEVIRSLNDEYKMARANPVEYVESPLLSKSTATSVDRFNTAESHAKKGSYCESLSRYTESIAYAEDGSEELTLAYANRSLSLYRLDLYDQCVNDINRAMAGSITLSMREELQERKNQCIIKKSEEHGSESQVKLISIPDGPSNRIVEVEKICTSNHKKDAQREWRDMCLFKNTRIPNTSSKIRLGYDERKWGRFIEATEDIKTGEVVASQKWFTVYLNELFKRNRCSYCLTLCAALIPCRTCSQIMYCSENCRDRAYDSYHRLECKLMKLFFGPNHVEDLEFHMSRALLIGTEQGAQLGDLMRRMTVRDLTRTDFPPSETFVDDYPSFLRLDRTYCRERVKKYVRFVARMIEVLEYVGFFDGDPSFRSDPQHQDTLTEAQIFTAFLLLNHTVGMNSHYFNLMPINDLLSSSSIEIIGTAHSTLFLAFNNSCDSNIIAISRNQEVAFIANRPVAKGEELTLTCGYSYATDDFPYRQEEINTQYGFTCQCVPCSNYWPTMYGLNQAGPVFYKHIKQEKAKYELQTIISPILDLEKFRSLSVKEILQMVLDVCKWLYTNTRQPSFDHGRIQTLVYTFMSLRYDDYCQFIATDGVILHAYNIFLQIVDRMDVDMNSFQQSPARRRLFSRRSEEDADADEEEEEEEQGRLLRSRRRRRRRRRENRVHF